MKDVSRAINLFQACIQNLIDNDNFKPIYLYDIQRYVVKSFLLERIKEIDFLEYEKEKENLLNQAEKCGYPTLEEIDARSLDDDMADFLSHLETHILNYGVEDDKTDELSEPKM